MTDTQEACADPALSSTSSPQKAGEGAMDTEYVELSEMEERSLHKTLCQAYAAAPEESGAIDEALDAPAFSPEPCDLLRRATLLGVPRSVWFEISKRSVSDIEAFLKAEERPNDPGASSSAG